MPINFDSALGIHESALKLRAKRAEVLANNLANVDTPNYKARDLDFRAALKGQMQNQGSSLKMTVSNEKHHNGQSLQTQDEGLLYRTAQQPSIDGNTVEEHVEHGEYMKNSLAFQASFTFLNGKFKGLQSALRGE